MSHDFLKTTAKRDVSSLHNCLSTAMFRSLSEMIRDAWKEAGEVELADTFFGSYIDQPNYNVWFCAASGISCCIPCNNPNERNTLSIKGTKTEDGLCRVGLDFGQMLRIQFPTMIYKLSLNNVGVTRNFLVDNEKLCFRQDSNTYKQLMMYNENFDCEIDEKESMDNNQITYMNSLHYQGKSITNKRIKQYENGLLGITVFGFHNRHKFVEQVHSLCKVKRVHNLNGDTVFRGSCSEFVKTGYCDHSATCKYREKVIIHSEPIPRKRASVQRKFKTSSAAESIREKHEDILRLTETVVELFDESKTNSFLHTGLESDLSLVIRDTPNLLLFSRNLRENQSQARNKHKLHVIHSKMKIIKCHSENLLDETALLELDSSIEQCRKAFDVAHVFKLHLEQLIEGKPSSSTPIRRRIPKNQSSLCTIDKWKV